LSHDCTGITHDNPSAECENATSHKQFSSSKCNYQDCKNRELIPVTCDFCNKEFCLIHRHQQDHECEKLEKSKNVESKTAILVKNILDSKGVMIKENKQFRAKNATKINAQVSLMKLKLNATGEKTIPANDRIYFGITLPITTVTKAYFFSKTWTIGKLVDYIANGEKLVNLNNVSSAKKLKIFQEEGKEDIPTDSTLDTLIANQTLINGQNLTLKYFD